MRGGQFDFLERRDGVKLTGIGAGPIPTAENSVEPTARWPGVIAFAAHAGSPLPEPTGSYPTLEQGKRSPIFD